MSYFVLILIGTGMFIGGAIFSFFITSILLPRQFPIKVILWSKQENGFFPFLDGGKILHQNGSNWLSLRRAKKKLIAIENKYIINGLDGKKHVHVFMPNSDEFYPMTVNVSDKNVDITPIPEKHKALFGTLTAEILRTYNKKGFMEKYGPIISVSAVIIVTIFMFILSYQYMGDMTNQWINAVSNAGKDVIQHTGNVLPAP